MLLKKVLNRAAVVLFWVIFLAQWLGFWEPPFWMVK